MNKKELISKIDNINQETQFIIGANENVKNHYANGYQAGIDMAKIIINEQLDIPNICELLNDLEKKHTEIYSDIESADEEDIKKYGLNDDYCEGWYQAFEDTLNLIQEN